ncbi:type II toxin-antitoxin system Phd/YefM family antitoxin [Zhihengliuella flava]|uniref:Prevent-host-death family protein n=1 Tax=Zhihengliuella flava TaxID=1285193 RepID=A0A931GFA1_9MICC|nr:type II toxin-antitoxin system prevent-host-death family antitoxin [Zhihengliuella flava]MBG6084437.1 prevent-host-death family protein [Zhihengliuella flava]
MKSISKRDLNQKTAKVLDRISAENEPVLITERGRPRWRIEPVDGQTDLWERLRTEGRLTRPKTGEVLWPTENPGDYTQAEVGILLDWAKGEH